MAERAIRTLKEPCAHHRFESLMHASRIAADWIGFYNHRRPHQALGMKMPAKMYELAGLCCINRVQRTKPLSPDGFMACAPLSVSPST
ncbi:integrase core domain-containing protein [Paludibacterium yongneupense]